MNPAYSVIFFTTASGAGYGLLIWLGVASVFFDMPAHRWFGLAAFAVALALITVGLLASTFHLGHPERAWRGLTQWRSSWLSREGVVAVLTFIPAKRGAGDTGAPASLPDHEPGPAEAAGSGFLAWVDRTLSR